MLRQQARRVRKGISAWTEPTRLATHFFAERNWTIVTGLKKIAAEAGETPARIALAWVCGRPGVTSTLMGVSRADQVRDNAAALDIVLAPEQREALDQLSAPADPRLLYSLFTPVPRQYAVFGGAVVNG